jgi:hypothetical protein
MLMNKRILDGTGVWKSGKIARIQPEWIRAEYANWIPLALANGSFEADTRRIWATVYSYNRPDISIDDVDEIKREFCRVGLIFLWLDDASGKIWGYFTGIEKPGRLPAKSRLDKKHELIGPTPPADALRSYLELTRSKALDAAVVSQWLANGCLGFGFGLGSGLGLGVGKTRSQETVSPSTNSGAATNCRRQELAPGDLRFQPFFSYVFESYRVKHQRPPIWTGKDKRGLKNLLRNQSPEALPLSRLTALWDNYSASSEVFTVKQHDSLAYFCSNVDKFSDGPILIAPGKGTNGKPTATELAMRNAKALGLDGRPN